MTVPWQEPFFEALSRVPIVSHAARKAGVDRTYIYKLKLADPAFAKRLAEAMEKGVETAERELFRRAVQGTKKGVWHQGIRVGEEVVYSDALLALFLKAYKKPLYAERTEITGADGEPLGGAVDDTARAARIAALMALAQQRKDGTAPPEPVAGPEDWF